MKKSETCQAITIDFSLTKVDDIYKPLTPELGILENNL